MPTIAFHSVKGGAGCTTVASLFALQLHRGQNPVHLSTAGSREQLDDVANILGVKGINDYRIGPVGPDFTIGVDRSLPDPSQAPYLGDLADVIQVVDVGMRHPMTAWPVTTAVVLVIRNDIMSLQRAMYQPLPVARISGLVVLEDPTWPLHDIDVSEAMGLPILETFTTDARFQRHLDAGIIHASRHPHFFHSLDRLVGVRA